MEEGQITHARHGALLDDLVEHRSQVFKGCGIAAEGLQAVVRL